MIGMFTHADVVDALRIGVLLTPRTCLIVDDSRMPVMDGMAFLRRLRVLPGGAGPKVLFCTIETRAERIAEALAAGADDYVMKPFDGDILTSKFAEVGAA